MILALIYILIPEISIITKLDTHNLLNFICILFCSYTEWYDEVLLAERRAPRRHTAASRPSLLAHSHVSSDQHRPNAARLPARIPSRARARGRRGVQRARVCFCIGFSLRSLFSCSLSCEDLTWSLIGRRGCCCCWFRS